MIPPHLSTAFPNKYSGLPGLLRHLRTLVRWRVRYRVTMGGALFAVALAFSGLVAFLTANNLLFLIFSALMALLVVSGFLSRLVLAGLEVELLLPEHVCARAPTPARIRVRNLKRRTPSFSIELSGQRDRLTNTPSILQSPVYFPVIPGWAAMEAPVHVTFPRRGRHTDNVFVVSTHFPFGFLRRTTAVQLRRETLVYPSLANPGGAALALDEALGELESAARGFGRDFHRIRPWEASDSARHVDWKSTAHTGAVQVREFSRDEHRTADVFFDRRAAAVEYAAFEEAVERCAWCLWQLDERGFEVLFHSQGYTFHLPGDGEVYATLAWLALTEPLFSAVIGRDSQADTGAGESPETDHLRLVFSASGTVPGPN